MNLKTGDTGSNVLQLQRYLKVQPVTGYYGTITMAAVKTWQAHNKFPQTGNVSDLMWEAMFPSTRKRLDLNKLKGIIPDKVIAQLTKALPRIKNPSILVMSHFIAQCMVESMNFTKTRENLNYSEEGLYETFNKYFPTLSMAELYAHQPEKIANRVYANRMGNGSPESGDGWKFRAAGYIGTTGRTNFYRLSKYLAVDVISNPELVATAYPLEAALFYFTDANIWPVCEEGSSISTTTKVRKLVNGGTIGLDDAIAYFNKVYITLLS